jgi:gas vesicle protein
MSNEACSGEKTLFFLVGAALGAVTALLLAPRSGAETRKLIAARAREGADVVANRSKAMADMAASYIDLGKDAAASYIDRGKEALQHQKDQLTAAFEAGKQVYKEEKDKA